MPDRFSDIYAYPETPGLDFDQKNPESISLTQQHFKKDADINYIMERFEKTGVLGNPDLLNAKIPIWGDFSTVRDFKAQMELITRINESFDQLDYQIKNRFNHDPQALLDFLADPANAEEAVKMGLRKAPQKPAEPVAVPLSAPAPAVKPAP